MVTLAPHVWDNAATWTGLESGAALVLILGEGYPAWLIVMLCLTKLKYNCKIDRKENKLNVERV